MAVRKRRNKRASRHGRYRFRKGRFFIFILGLAAMAVLIGAIWVGRVKGKLDSEIIYPGVSVDGISLAGQTQQEAMLNIQQKVDNKLDRISIELTYMGNSWVFSAADIGAKADVETQVAAAFRAGREGTWRSRTDEIDRLAKQGLELKTSVTYDVELLREKIETIKTEVDSPARNASVEFAPGVQGSDMFTYTEAVVGWKLDTETILDQIAQEMKQKWDVSVALQPMRIEPTVTVEQLKRANKVIAEFSTDFSSSSPNRKENIRRSLAAFDGVTLGKGDKISFNETTGERTPENGYKDAPVIAENKALVDGPGGGVCQTSSTLYNAALLADLTIVRRSHHSFPLSYVEPGLDATVNWPNLDLVIQNDNELPVFIHTYTYQDRAYVQIFGEPRADGRTVKLVNDIYSQEDPPAPEIIEDKDAKYVTYSDKQHELVKSRAGIKVRSYQVFYKDGEEVERVMVRDDYYQPIVGKIYVGVTPPLEATPSPSPTDSPNATQSPNPTSTPAPTDEPVATSDPGNGDDGDDDSEEETPFSPID